MKKISGFNFLLLALCAFGGLAIEALYAFLFEPVLYGAQMQDWTTLQVIIHWIITCITWGIVAFLLIRVANRKYQFNVLKKSDSLKTYQWIVIVISIAFMLVWSYIDWNGFKVIQEFQSNGVLKFVFQYIYYIFETMLFTLIIVFGQKACEIWFKKENFPYGGILVALTWGLGHIITKGSLITGLGTAFAGFIFGVVYLLVNRDIKKTFIILFIMFVF